MCLCVRVILRVKARAKQFRIGVGQKPGGAGGRGERIYLARVREEVEFVLTCGGVEACVVRRAEPWGEGAQEPSCRVQMRKLRSPSRSWKSHHKSPHPLTDALAPWLVRGSSVKPINPNSPTSTQSIGVCGICQISYSHPSQPSPSLS